MNLGSESVSEESCRIHSLFVILFGDFLRSIRALGLVIRPKLWYIPHIMVISSQPCESFLCSQNCTTFMWHIETLVLYLPLGGES